MTTFNFEEAVIKMANAKGRVETLEDELKQRTSELRAALQTLKSRVQYILDNEEKVGFFEVAFLDQALIDINEADRRYEITGTAIAGARRESDLLEEIVSTLKEYDK